MISLSLLPTNNGISVSCVSYLSRYHWPQQTQLINLLSTLQRNYVDPVTGLMNDNIGAGDGIILGTCDGVVGQEWTAEKDERRVGVGDRVLWTGPPLHWTHVC